MGIQVRKPQRSSRWCLTSTRWRPRRPTGTSCIAVWQSQSSDQAWLLKLAGALCSFSPEPTLAIGTEPGKGLRDHAHLPTLNVTGSPGGREPRQPWVISSSASSQPRCQREGSQPKWKPRRQHPPQRRHRRLQLVHGAATLSTRCRWRCLPYLVARGRTTSRRHRRRLEDGNSSGARLCVVARSAIATHVPSILFARSR